MVKYPVTKKFRYRWWMVFIVIAGLAYTQTGLSVTNSLEPFSLYHPLFNVPESSLIVQNVEANQAMVSFSVYNETGLNVYSSSSSSIDPGVPNKIDAHEMIGLATGKYSLVTQADHKTQSMIVTQLSDLDGDNLAIYPGCAEPYTSTVTAPIFKGLEGYYSTLHIQNASFDPVNVTIQFYTSEGQAIAETSKNSVPSNSTVTVQIDEISELPFNYSGWAEISATGNINVSLENAGSQAIEIGAPIGFIEHNNRQFGVAHQYVLPRLFNKYDEGAGSRSSRIVLVNPGELAATITITYTNVTGTSSAAPEIDIAPKSMQLVNLTGVDYPIPGNVYSAIISSTMPVVVDEMTRYDSATVYPVDSYKLLPESDPFLSRLIRQGNHFSVINLQNTGLITSTIGIVFASLDGSFTSPINYSLAPGRFTRINIKDIQQLSDGFEGGAILSPSTPIAVQVDEYILEDNPLPQIVTLIPRSIQAGTPGITLTVTGMGFIQKSTVKWNGSVRTTNYITANQLEAAISGADLLVPGKATITVENPPPGGGTSNTLKFAINVNIYLPGGYRDWPPLPDMPILNQITNPDQDNKYSVNWTNTGNIGYYVLQESNDATFTSPIIVYQGYNLSWSVPYEGKLPGSYFYRVKTVNQYGESDWSHVQAIKMYPLFTGLMVSWDGKGFLRLDDYYEPGMHERKICDLLTDPDTLRCTTNLWYNPNPLDFESESWNSYYSTTTGGWKGSDAIDDPAWKWGHSWKLGYDSTFSNGSTVYIDNQEFTVSGPHSGFTSYGKAITYWEFINQEKFLFWDDGGEWTQNVHAGDIVLRYDAGNSKLLIYDSILRHYYYQGDLTEYTIQYISNLTSANSLPNSPPMPLTNNSTFDLHVNPSYYFDQLPGLQISRVRSE